MKNKPNYLAILTFYVIAITLRYLTNKTDLLSAVPNAFLKAVLTGIGPTVGAIVAFALFKIKPVMSLKGNYKSMLVPFLLYWLLPMALILGAEYFAKGTVSILGVTAVLVYGLFEEIGWRGFLQQQLGSLPKFPGILIVTVMWFAWHLNFDLTASNLVFFGILLLGTWGISKVADTTLSLLAASAFHSLNNFFHELDATKTTILAALLFVWILSLIVSKKMAKKNKSQATEEIAPI